MALRWSTGIGRNSHWLAGEAGQRVRRLFDIGTVRKRATCSCWP